jgi:hypothetical protein
MKTLTNSGILARELSSRPYAWGYRFSPDPSISYPRYAVTDDGGALCKECCKTEFNSIDSSSPCDGWHVIGLEVNYEERIYCDHCSSIIESAYGDEE